jgi:hypothetical protein
MGVVDDEEPGTHVGPGPGELPQGPLSDEDVFGSAAEPADAQDEQDEATRVRSSKPGTIALVVEDAKARDRLRKHLEPWFSALFEAHDANAAASLDEFPRVDALVFVRPSRSEGTSRALARIGRMARRPRVLVISTDPSFDDVPGVDLRLPLGQKASEVAQQVLDGLGRLGVSTIAG